MTGDKIVHGIFFSMGVLRNGVRERSHKALIALVFVIVLALCLIVALVGFGLNSSSRFGTQVVGGTFLFAVTMLVIYILQKRRVAAGLVKRSVGRLLLVVVCVGLSLAVMLLSLLIMPLRPVVLWNAILIGGLVLTFVMILLYDGHRILKERGTPGLIAEAGLLIVSGIVYMTAVSIWIVPYDPTKLNVGPLLSPPSPGFPLGTTALGQDLLSRTIAGGTIMLQVAILSVVVCFSVGVPLGLAASFKGGLWDRGVCLFMDSIYAFPGLVLAIAIAAMLGPGVVNMALAIAFVYIPSYFRVVRSQVLTVKELPYVEAAVVMGARSREILLRYILPNILPSAVVVMSINFADAILTAAGLTFVGLGLPVNVPDWGWDLSFGWGQLISGAWWVITFPGLMIVLLALGFTLAGEGFNEILTPKLKE